MTIDMSRFEAAQGCHLVQLDAELFNTVRGDDKQKYEVVFLEVPDRSRPVQYLHFYAYGRECGYADGAIYNDLAVTTLMHYMEAPKPLEAYSMRLFIWDYHPRRRGNDQREVTCNITEFYTNKETARRRYDELKRRFDFETSHHNTYGFIRLAEADHRNDGQLFEGYKVVDGCEAEAKR